MKSLFSFFEHFVVLFLVTPFVFLIEYLINYATSPALSIAVFSYIYLFIFGIIGIVSAYLTASDKFRPSYVFVAIIIISLICFTGFSLLIQSFKAEIAILTIFEILIINKLSTVIVFHDDFIELCGDLKGYKLKDHLYQNKFAAMDLGEQIKKTKNIMYILSVYIIGIIIAEHFERGLNTFLIIISLLFLLNYIIYLYIMSYYKKEIFYLNIGLTQIIPERKKFYRLLVLILTVSVLLGSIFARNQAPVKINIVSDYIAEETVEEILPPVQNEYIPVKNPEGVFLSDYPVLSKIINAIYEFFDCIAIFIGSIIKVVGRHIWSYYYFYLPLLLGSGIVLYFRDVNYKRVFELVSKLLKRFAFKLKNGFKGLSKKNTLNDDYVKVSKQDFLNSIIGNSKRTKKSKEKRVELDRLTRQFIKVIGFGTKYKINYTKNLAPCEYTNLLKNHLLEKSKDEKSVLKAEACVKAGQIFERALYDKDTLPLEEEKEFLKCINVILAK